MSGDSAKQEPIEKESPETAGKAIEGTGFGAKVKIPWVWAQYVGPYMKWPIIAFSAGLFALMVLWGVSMLVKK